MKRFRWRLQTVLDVAATRERSVRMELFRLSSEAIVLRREIIARQQELREMFVDLGEQNLSQRLNRLQVMLACSETVRRYIRRLEASLKEIQRRRDEKLAQAVALRARRKTLEQLREEAQRKHQKEWEAVEQKQLDETANLRSARRVLSRLTNDIGAMG
jgi:flagellar biosynthesis chaperone FliJ